MHRLPLTRRLIVLRIIQIKDKMVRQVKLQVAGEVPTAVTIGVPATNGRVVEATVEDMAVRLVVEAQQVLQGHLGRQGHQARLGNQDMAEVREVEMDHRIQEAVAVGHPMAPQRMGQLTALLTDQITEVHMGHHTDLPMALPTALMAAAVDTQLWFTPHQPQLDLHRLLPRLSRMLLLLPLHHRHQQQRSHRLQGHHLHNPRRHLLQTTAELVNRQTRT